MFASKKTSAPGAKVSAASSPPPTILAQLHKFAACSPDKPCISFYEKVPNALPLGPSPENTTYTYKQLLASAYALSERLKSLKAKKGGGPALAPGARVLLVYPPSPSFLVSFIGESVRGAKDEGGVHERSDKALQVPQ